MYRLTPGRRKRIKTWLGWFSLDDLKRAVDHLAASTFHSGDNEDGRRYDTLEVLRSREKIENWIAAKAKRASKDDRWEGITLTW